MPQETILRFRVYRVWNIPERPALHGSKSLIFSSDDPGNAEEFALTMREAHAGLNDQYVVEDSGKDKETIDVYHW